MTYRLILCLILAGALRAPGDDRDDALLTVAERSGFKATATHAEVVELLDRLAAASPLVSRMALGRSGEGREIPAIFAARCVRR